MKKSLTLVLAGNYDEYQGFLNTKGAPSTDYVYFTKAHTGLTFDRAIVTGTFRQLKNALSILKNVRKGLAPGVRIVYDDVPDSWYVSGWDKIGDPILRDANSRLRCGFCRRLCNETYKGGFCSSCAAEGTSFPEGFGLVKKNNPKPNYPVLSAPYQIRNEGDIWKLPKANSPMWTEQWGYQGSAKAPYIISKRDESRVDGSTTATGWACACPNFTRHTPRTPCKHILNVILKEGLGAVKPVAAKLANVDDKKLKAFEKWEREQAARDAGNNPTSGVKLNLFGATTRKFR
jgi:hypothetical protein